LEKDLPFVKDALSHPTTPILQHAYVGPTLETMEAFCSALPVLALSAPSSPFYDPPSSPNSVAETSLLESIQMAHLYISSLPLSYKYINTTTPGSLNRLSKTCSWIERHSKGVLTWAEKICWMVSPVPWRDDLGLRCLEVIIKRQREDMDVGDIKSVLEETSLLLHNSTGEEKGKSELKGFIQVLEWSEEQMKIYYTAQEALVKLKKEEDSGKGEEGEESVVKEDDGSSSSVSIVRPRPIMPEITESTLSFLESFHKILVFYMWMLFRNSVVFSDQETTEGLKKRVEVVLDWALQVISYSQKDTNEKVKKGKGKGKGKGKLGSEGLFTERASIKQLMEDYERRNVKEGKREERAMEKSVWSNGREEEGRKGTEIGVMDNAEIKAKNKRPWVQAPDLTTLLKNYVDNSDLKVGRRRGNYS
jgi:hypothetical protein